MKVLANDGISKNGAQSLKDAGYEVIEKKVAQNQLENYLNENDISVILVRSATKIRKDLIDACPDLKLIGRGGVGLDNIDVEYAEKQGVKVVNTPAASSRSVAELVFAHLFGGIRNLNKANRDMPLEGEKHFKDLKKQYKGRELENKTLGIIGFGRIGHKVTKIALGIGMKVLVHEKNESGGELPIELEFADAQKITLNVKATSKEKLLKKSDFVSVHVPTLEDYLIGSKELELMKDNAGLVNAARGGVVDEEAVDIALGKDQLGFAALDVFENEPKPPIKLLMNPKLSLSPHVGGATEEAQDRIGLELAEQIIAIFGRQN